MSKMAKLRTNVARLRTAQRGQLFLPLTGWLAVGAGVVIIGLGIAVKVQSARLDAAQQKNVALEQQVSQWQAASKACSDGVSKVEEEAKKRARMAQEALAKARLGSVASQAEADRLRAIVNSGGTCQAAVVEVRKGLR